ncbi:Ig-like domain-containing protein [Myxococcus sp. Y35]|uniref:Ig-like domain-containing protein n=1 Tax=Pseudomyxococcus flavus TaxID=3115648 RepID=UPI003CFAE48F
MPPPPHEEEPPPALRVTVRTEGPAFCREGLWTLTVSVEGDTPERVELLTNGEAPTRLEAPFQHVVDCATHAEGRFAFTARAVAGDRSFDAEAVAVTVDRTPPTIVAARPSHKYPSVASPMAFVFSEPLRPDSLQSEPTELQDFFNSRPIPVAHQAVLSDDGMVLELVPTSPLQPPVSLAATLLQRSLTDLAGNSLDPSLPDFVLRHSANYWPFVSVTAPLLPEHVDPLPASLVLANGVAGTTPVVGYFDYDYMTNAHKPTIARWDGHAWQRLPPFRAANEGSANIIAFQVAARDDAIVAEWRERDAVTGLEQSHVANFTGNGWEHLPVPDDTPSKYDWVKMTLAPQGRPVIAVGRSIDTYETEVRVIRWTGTEWQRLGEPLSENPAPRTPAWQVAIAADDTRVVVSWEEKAVELGPPSSYLHVRTFENGSWVPVGASIPVREYSSVNDIALAIQPDHRVIMAWAESGAWIDTGNGPIIGIPDVIRFSSAALGTSQTSWAPPEDAVFLPDINTYASLYLVVGPDIEPWLAWDERSVNGYIFARSYITRLRATGWEPKQLIGYEPLYGFLLDEDGSPWALLGDDVVRPQ